MYMPGAGSGNAVRARALVGCSIHMVRGTSAKWAVVGGHVSLQNIVVAVDSTCAHAVAIEMEASVALFAVMAAFAAAHTRQVQAHQHLVRVSVGLKG